MFVSLKANKKRLVAFVVLVAVVIGACLLLNLKGGDTETKEYYGATNEERVAFLQGFGWEVSNEPMETREVMIPESFSDVYIKYNDMQKQQDFDLKPYAGFICMQYKYQILNYPDEREVFATLLVYDDQILGGDLACSEVDGFMHGFASDSVRYGEKANKSNDKKAPDENAVENQNNANGSKPNENGSNRNKPNENNAGENANKPNENNAGENQENAGGNSEENNQAENNAAETDGEVYYEEEYAEETDGDIYYEDEYAEETDGDIYDEDGYPTD